MGSQKITQELERLIRSGEAAVGEYLPSTRELAGRYGVSLNTVHAAMKELAGLKLVECRPRRGAVVLAMEPESERPASRQIGILLGPRHEPQFESNWRLEWSWTVLHALDAELFESGYSSTMIPWPAGGADGLRHRLEKGQIRPGGIVGPGQLLDDEVRKALEKSNIPWVAIGRPAGEDDCDCNYVSAANIEGTRKIGRLFAKSGYTQVAILANNPTASAADLEKVTGFFQGYLERDVSTEGIHLVNCRSYEELAGYRAVRQMLGKGSRPQGIFATGDVLALGAIHALHDEGIEVPKDVSVAGATGLTQSARFDPPLTVVRQPMEEMGRTVGQMILQMVREGVRKFAPRRIPCELIMRESMAAASVPVARATSPWFSEGKQ